VSADEGVHRSLASSTLSVMEVDSVFMTMVFHKSSTALILRTLSLGHVPDWALSPILNPVVSCRVDIRNEGIQGSHFHGGEVVQFTFDVSLTAGVEADGAPTVDYRRIIRRAFNDAQISVVNRYLGRYSMKSKLVDVSQTTFVPLFWNTPADDVEDTDDGGEPTDIPTSTWLPTTISVGATSQNPALEVPSYDLELRGIPMAVHRRRCPGELPVRFP